MGSEAPHKYKAREDNKSLSQLVRDFLIESSKNELCSKTNYVQSTAGHIKKRMGGHMLLDTVRYTILHIYIPFYKQPSVAACKLCESRGSVGIRGTKCSPLIGQRL